MKRSTRATHSSISTPLPVVTPTTDVPADDAAMQARYRADLAALREERAAKLPPLQRAWGTWLFEYLWAWFVTLTFRLPIHPEQAHKYLLKWLSALEHDPARDARHPFVWACGEER